MPTLAVCMAPKRELIGPALDTWRRRVNNKVAYTRVSRSVNLAYFTPPSHPTGCHMRRYQSAINHFDKLAKRAAIFAILAAFAFYGAQSRADDESAAVEKRLADSARYLTSDACEGRGIGTKGLDLAADFIAQQFAQCGLVTTTYSGQPFQQFTLLSNTRSGEDNKAAFVKPPAADGDKSETVELAAGNDFSPFSISGAGTIDAPLVFAGYGITAEKEGYDDYASIDAAGKAVIVLRHQPQTKLKDGTALSSPKYITLDSKIANAQKHNAAAVIFCTDAAEVAKNKTSGKSQDAADPLFTFYYTGRNQSANDIPVIHCRRSALEPVVKSAVGAGMESLETKIDEGPAPQSRDLGPWRLTGKIDVQGTPYQLKNVVAVLEGQGSTAVETIVVGAHYDHLGNGGRHALDFFSRSIHPGADDNASGTSVMMEVAHAMSAREKKLNRRVVFVAFSGEEEGMLGSKYYARHPAAPLEKTVAMINLDMVGRLRNENLTVYGSQTAKEFGELLDKHGPSGSFNLIRPSAIEADSDHSPFYNNRVPFLFFYTETHPQYHRATDTFDTLNIPGMRRVAQFVEQILVELADAPARPAFSG
jgi:hypothetical protein